MKWISMQYVEMCDKTFRDKPQENTKTRRTNEEKDGKNKQKTNKENVGIRAPAELSNTLQQYNSNGIRFYVK